MTRTIALAVALAVFALGGYWLGIAKQIQTPAVSVTSAAKKAPKHCKQNAPSCDTDVSVVWDCPGNCVTVVLDDVIVVKGGTTITWNLKHEKFKFLADGIAFDPSSGVTCNAGPKKFECKTSTDPTKTGTLKYTINLASQDGSAGPTPLDPYVVNN